MVVDEILESFESKNFPEGGVSGLKLFLQRNIDKVDAVFHPVGFILISLDNFIRNKPENYSLRLHIWDKNVDEYDDLGGFHTHVWELDSYVVKGSIQESIFIPESSSEGKYWGSRINYSNNNSSTYSGKYNLNLCETRIHQAGDFYSLPTGVVHHSFNQAVPTVSIVRAAYDESEMGLGPLVLSEKTQIDGAEHIRKKLSHKDVVDILNILDS